MASQYARLSKFKADFKQQQGEMTNKIDTLLKAINDRMTGALLSDTVKNPKLNVNPTFSVSSARSYPIEDPQTSSYPFNLVNAIKTCFKSTNDFQKDRLQLPVLEVLAHAPMYNAILDKYVESLEVGKNGSAFIQGEMLKKIKDLGLFTLPCRLRDSKPFDTLTDLGSCVNLILLYLFKKLNIRIFEETKNVLGLADGTNLYEEGPHVSITVGRGFLEMASAIIDCKKAKITVGEGVTRSIFRVKEIGLSHVDTPYWTTLAKRKSYESLPSTNYIGARPPYYLEKDFINNHLPGELEIARDAELNPFKDVLVFRKMVEFLGAIPINLKGNIWESKDFIEKKIDWKRPPKEGDGA
ncbi:hypothetical protein Tco_0428836 [Tanacetum coccineum]